MEVAVVKDTLQAIFRILCMHDDIAKGWFHEYKFEVSGSTRFRKFKSISAGFLLYFIAVFESSGVRRPFLILCDLIKIVFFLNKRSHIATEEVQWVKKRPLNVSRNDSI